VEKLQSWVAIQVCDTSDNRGSNLAPFDKISKSGDGKINLFYGNNNIQLLLTTFD